VLSTPELLECGLSHPAITRRAKRGWLHQLHRGVWAVGHANPPWEGRLVAAAKACGPDAVVSHWSAAELWGFVDREDRQPHVLVPQTSRRVVPGVFVHRTCVLEACDRRRHRGVPVTAPARTLLDLAGLGGVEVARRAARTAQGLHCVTLRQMADVIRRLRPRRGAGRLAVVIAQGAAPVRSVLESVVLDMLLAAGFEHPQVNQPLVIEGRRVIPDFRWPRQRLVLEADGARWHDGELARAADDERQRWLERHGETVLRVSWDEAVRRAEATAARLRAAGAPPAAER
jgi:very-short-patch-repair endonuclease